MRHLTVVSASASSTSSFRLVRSVVVRVFLCVGFVCVCVCVAGAGVEGGGRLRVFPSVYVSSNLTGDSL